MVMTEKEMDEQLELERKEAESNGLSINIVKVLDAEDEILSEDSYHGISSLVDSIIEKKKNVKLEIGTVYGVLLKDIKGSMFARKTRFDIGTFDWRLVEQPLDSYNVDVKGLNDKVGNKYTLVKYVGNSEFIELYTNKTIRLNSVYPADLELFVDEVGKVISNPLMVNMNSLVEVDNSIRSSVVTNDSELVVSYINNLDSAAREFFDSQLDILWQEDYKYAKEEDRIRVFEKTK